MREESSGSSERVEGESVASRNRIELKILSSRALMFFILPSYPFSHVFQIIFPAFYLIGKIFNAHSFGACTWKFPQYGFCRNYIPLSNMLSSELKIWIYSRKKHVFLCLFCFVLMLKLPAFGCFSSTLIIMENFLSTTKRRKKWQRENKCACLRRKKLSRQVQKRSNFYTNCSEINGLCIFAATRALSFSLLKSCFVHANFSQASQKLFLLKNSEITFSHQILSFSFPPKTLHDLFFIRSTEPSSYEQYLLILTLYYMLETISVHVSFGKAFPMETQSQARQGKARMAERYLNILHAQEILLVTIEREGWETVTRGRGVEWVESFVIEYFNKITFFGEMAMLYASVSFFWGNLLLWS